MLKDLTFNKKIIGRANNIQNFINTWYKAH